MEEEMCFKCRRRPRLPSGILCHSCKNAEPPSTTGVTRDGGGGSYRGGGKLRRDPDNFNVRIEPDDRDDDGGFGRDPVI